MTRDKAKEIISYHKILVKMDKSGLLDKELEYQAIDMAIEALEQQPRWIPTSEKLPEECTAVLIWCPERKNIYCAYLEEKQWWIFGEHFTKVTLDVTAWMPLPLPYKAEGEETK